MQKLLVVCGPTSTGKTRLALRLAKKFNGEILSADSRQVYKWMDVGTGKDLPPGAKLRIPWFRNFGYYEINGIKVWGYDLADPRGDFSVAGYLRFAERIIADIEKRKRLPIVVGGTGLYVKAIVDGIGTVAIPRSERIRKSLEKKGASELFEMLAQLDPIKAGGMNSSDRKNPRRLIRAIEVAISKRKPAINRQPPIKNVLFIGLSVPENILAARIEKRVEERIQAGVEKEIDDLLKKRVSWKNQAMTSLGYRQWKGYFSGQKQMREVVESWMREEKKYAKRQITWFKKDGRIHWFDISKKGFERKVEKMAEKWYIT